MSLPAVYDARSFPFQRAIIVQFSRRAFFGAARKGRGNPFRPPWAIAESSFTDRCSRCGDCVRVCPTDLLVSGAGSFPEADFTPGRASDGCTFCGECLRACTTGALLAQSAQAPWRLRVVFGAECLTQQGVVCHTCSDFCDANAIRFQLATGGISRPELDEQACTGCALCLADCPTQAIRMARSTSSFTHFLGAA